MLATSISGPESAAHASFICGKSALFESPASVQHKHRDSSAVVRMRSGSRAPSTTYSAKTSSTTSAIAVDAPTKAAVMPQCSAVSLGARAGPSTFLRIEPRLRRDGWACSG